MIKYLFGLVLNSKNNKKAATCAAFIKELTGLNYKPASLNTLLTISCASCSINAKCSAPLKLSQ